MFDLSPLKVLVVLVVALVLLGPDKVPQFARQLGAAWTTLRRWHQRIEEEVRSTVPDLPSTQEIARAVRSPASFLESLAAMEPDRPGREPTAASDPGAAGAAPTWPAPGGRHLADGARAATRRSGGPTGPGPGVTVPDDPGMN